MRVFDPITEFVPACEHIDKFFENNPIKTLEECERYINDQRPIKEMPVLQRKGQN